VRLLCKLGIHSWLGCRCEHCPEWRDEEHKFEGCKCLLCSIKRDQNHSWDGCKCSRCESTRDEAHRWEGLSCNVCGKPNPEKMHPEEKVCSACNGAGGGGCQGWDYYPDIYSECETCSGTGRLVVWIPNENQSAHSV
jgi:hypothetical protein